MLLQQMLQRRCAPPAARVPLVPLEAGAVVPQLPPLAKLPPLVPVP